MIGSVNSTPNVYTQAYSPVTQTNQPPKPEATETKTGEKNETASAQLREPEAAQTGAALLKTLNSSESQNLPAATQPEANSQASRNAGLKAYSETGKSQFNFA